MKKLINTFNIRTTYMIQNNLKDYLKIKILLNIVFKRKKKKKNYKYRIKKNKSYKLHYNFPAILIYHM